MNQARVGGENRARGSLIRARVSAWPTRRSPYTERGRTRRSRASARWSALGSGRAVAREVAADVEKLCRDVGEVKGRGGGVRVLGLLREPQHLVTQFLQALRRLPAVVGIGIDGHTLVRSPGLRDATSRMPHWAGALR